MPKTRGAPGPGWAGSNVDLGEFGAVDEDLRARVLRQDENLVRLLEDLAVVEEAHEAYLRKFAEAVASCPTEWPTAKKERHAKTEHVALRVAYDRAKLRYEFSALACRIAHGQINAVQTRSANLRAQLELDRQVPDWASAGEADHLPDEDVGAGGEAGAPPETSESPRPGRPPRRRPF